MNDIVQRDLYVMMERDHLKDVPCYQLPSEYSVKWFEPGDEQAWVDIHRRAEAHVDVSLEIYRRVFGDDEQALRARQCFLFDAQQLPIATATAWYDNDFHGNVYGRLHWVAVVPRCQGRGLSKPLLTIVFSRMVKLGYDRAYLRTSTSRLRAIDLYKKFGFTPSLRTAEDREVWQQLNGKLYCPFE